MQGADPAVVRQALDDGDPLPGTGGFAGGLDGLLVRDVLGRYPLFSDDGAWSADPTDLDDPEPVPAGHVRDLDLTQHDDRDRRAWTLPDPDPETDREAAVGAVRDAIGTNLEGLPAGTPVAFSGGVDSSLLAAATDGPLYVAGFEGSHDIAAARDSAAALGREGDLRVVELDHDDLRRAVPELARATGLTNPMDVAIALPLYLVAERAAADGHGCLAVGQGADELFGGYAKVAKAPADPRVDADTVRAARRETALTLPPQLERDVLALRGAGVEPVAPLLHDRMVAAALELPGYLLVSGDRRKVALREAAADLGLPAPARERGKKAVQYGTYVSRELDRLARQAGFKRRMDDHVGRYVESLVDSA
jgi:asparagine synthase (glutamine-hydrolysing)